MQSNVEKTLSLFDKVLLKANDYMYTASIAKEATTGKDSNGGVLIIGMIIVIVGLVGFIMTKNKN